MTEPKQDPAKPVEPVGPTSPIQGLTEGRIVHFVTNGGTIRPAIIVNAWGGKEQYTNLLVFPDGTNDITVFEDLNLRCNVPPYPVYDGSLIWKASIYFKPEQDGNGLWEKNSWHWPPRA